MCVCVCVHTSVCVFILCCLDLIQQAPGSSPSLVFSAFTDSHIGQLKGGAWRNNRDSQWTVDISLLVQYTVSCSESGVTGYITVPWLQYHVHTFLTGVAYVEHQFVHFCSCCLRVCSSKKQSVLAFSIIWTKGILGFLQWTSSGWLVSSSAIPLSFHWWCLA